MAVKHVRRRHPAGAGWESLLSLAAFAVILAIAVAGLTLFYIDAGDRTEAYLQVLDAVPASI